MTKIKSSSENIRDESREKTMVEMIQRQELPTSTLRSKEDLPKNRNVYKSKIKGGGN